VEKRPDLEIGLAFFIFKKLKERRKKMEQKELMEKQNLCETAGQESLGFLENGEQEDISGEVDKDSMQMAWDPMENYATQPEPVEDLDPQKIQPFELIPDYLEPTSLSYPLVVKTPDSITCIEGWSMVQKAREEGQSVIRCRVHHLKMVSDVELSIRKTAIRMMPQGGEASYAEKARNVAKIYRMLKSSKENLRMFAHGRAKGVIDIYRPRDINICNLLAKRFGKWGETITKYIEHADYLTDEAMQVLVQEKADKGFFEDFQEAKIKLVNFLQKQGFSQKEIVSRVSAEIIKIWNVPRKRRKKEIRNLLVNLKSFKLQRNSDSSEVGKEKITEIFDLDELCKESVDSKVVDQGLKPGSGSDS